MSMKRSAKIAVVATVGMVLTGGAAFAFWTAGGTGTGTAATGDTVDLVVAQAGTANFLRPGGSTLLHGTISNPNEGPIQLNGITATIESVTPASGKTCAASNYTLTDNSYIDAGGIGGTVDLGGFQNPIEWGGVTLNMVNSTANQDGCKGATVNLKYVVRP